MDHIPEDQQPTSQPDLPTSDFNDEEDPRLMMEQFLEQSPHGPLQRGETLTGTVVRVSPTELLVDIGYKTEGVVPTSEMASLSADERAAITTGDELVVVVVQNEDQEGRPVLSLDRAQQEQSWTMLQQQYETQDVIKAEVRSYNKGGVLVNIGGVRGFVPASQLLRLSRIPDAQKQNELAQLVGERLDLKVIEIDRQRNRLILSERQAVQEQREQRKGELLGRLREGEVRRGVVTSLADFGAFVDIGGADGLIHLSELSWSRIKHPSEVLKPGDEVDVYVLNIDEKRRRIALSLKRTQPEPWTTVNERYQLGQQVEATITQITSFGAFARLEDGIEGLIHSSELSDDPARKPEEVVQEGQQVSARIIRIDAARKRIGLSLRDGSAGAAEAQSEQD